MATQAYVKISLPSNMPCVHGSVKDFVHWFPVVTLTAWRDRLQLIITQAEQLQPYPLPNRDSINATSISKTNASKNWKRHLSSVWKFN